MLKAKIARQKTKYAELKADTEFYHRKALDEKQKLKLCKVALKKVEQEYSKTIAASGSQSRAEAPSENDGSLFLTKIEEQSKSELGYKVQPISPDRRSNRSTVVSSYQQSNLVSQNPKFAHFVELKLPHVSKEIRADIVTYVQLQETAYSDKIASLQSQIQTLQRQLRKERTK